MGDKICCPIFMKMPQERCCGCEACVQICPQRALKLTESGEGYLYPELIKEKCVQCNRCERVCPMLKIFPEDNADEVYYGISHRNTDVLLSSASGGLFTFLYSKFIERYPEGYVCGAIYSDGFEKVKHLVSNSLEDIQKMRSSKYFQSHKEFAYEQVEAKLKKNEAVFFTGTPCEVAALKLFLGKNYEKLWTLDFVCKGGGSPKILTDYVRYIKSKFDAEIIYLNMRYKWRELDNWIPQFVCFKFDNGKNYLREFYNTELGIGFQILQRKSCKECPFCEKKHYADFTIGDFHGISDKWKCFNRLGTSVMILNSSFAKKFWEQIDKSEINWEIITKKDVYENNRNPVDSRRKLLVKNLNKYNDAVIAIRKSINMKQKIKMVMPVKLLRKVTTWRKN